MKNASSFELKSITIWDKRATAALKYFLKKQIFILTLWYIKIIFLYISLVHKCSKKRNIVCPFQSHFQLEPSLLTLPGDTQYTGPS